MTTKLNNQQLNDRIMLIARAVYNDNAAFSDVGAQVGVSSQRAQQLYKAYATKCALARRDQGRTMKRNDLGLDLSLLTAVLKPIRKELARHNLVMKLGSRSRWSRDTSSVVPKGLDYEVEQWLSDLHQVVMLRRTVYHNGAEFWECNAHFFNQCLLYPERQGSKNGIYTKLP